MWVRLRRMDQKIKILLKKGASQKDLSKKQLGILEYMYLHGSYGEPFDAYSLSDILGCHPDTAKYHLEGLKENIQNIKFYKDREKDYAAIEKPKRVYKDRLLTFGTKEKSVKAMIISEYPLDSIMGDSAQSREARKGIIKYAGVEKPDVIFVDGLVSKVRYPEAYIQGVLESDPVNSFMQKPFEIASKFLSELKAANPYSEIYLALSDADESNIVRLTKERASQKATEVKSNIKSLKITQKSLNKEIELAKKKGKEAKDLEVRATELKDKIKSLERPSYSINETSKEYQQLKDEVTAEYVNKLKAMNSKVRVSLGMISTIIKGFSFTYDHVYASASSKPLKHRTNRLEEILNKYQMGKKEIPDFFIESGHHAEAIAHPYRHGLEDKYSLLVSAPVMEDQRIVQSIIDGEFKPERFQGKQNKLEACKRTGSKIPASGIAVVGKDEKGFFAFNYSLKHLSQIGRGDIKIENMDYAKLVLLSDIHIGKGAVRYKELEIALDKIYKEAKEDYKQGKSTPLLVMANESLQGRNYKTMVAETREVIPEEFRDKQKEKAKKGATIDDVIDENYKELSKRNQPNLRDQTKRYFYLVGDAVDMILLGSKYNPAVIYNEGTHIEKTIGEFGLSEVFLQTFPCEVADNHIKFLMKEGEIPNNEKLKNFSEKIKACDEGGVGYARIPIKLGEIDYMLSTSHKPGSSSPGSDIPMKEVRRATTMCDDADVFTSAHLHTPYFFVIGRQASNEITAFYKGATFNEYDPFGKMGGWSPAVVGYLKGYIPTNKNGKGVYGVRFITSDVLKDEREEKKPGVEAKPEKEKQIKKPKARIKRKSKRK